MAPFKRTLIFDIHEDTKNAFFDGKVVSERYGTYQHYPPCSSYDMLKVDLEDIWQCGTITLNLVQPNLHLFQHLVQKGNIIRVKDFAVRKKDPMYDLGTHKCSLVVGKTGHVQLYPANEKIDWNMKKF